MPAVMEKPPAILSRSRSRAGGAAGPPPSEDEASEDEHGHDSMIRVGADYQAVIPDCKPESPARYSNAELKGMLVWAPNHCVSDAKLDRYIAMAKDKHGYNIEQALGMLLWHKHDVEKSLADLANFTPFPDEWTVEDKVLFEQAFSFHGKSFARIQQMLPDKLIPSLVKYYYSWKKTRSRTSVMDRQARRLLGRRDRDDSNDETDEHRPSPEGDVEPPDPKKEQPCYPKAGPRKEPQYRHHPPARQRRRPPRGMRLSREDVAEVTANPDLGARALRQLDCQLVALKRQVRLGDTSGTPRGHPRGRPQDPCEPPPRSPQVQRIKQINSGLRQALDGGLEGLRPPEVGPRVPHGVPTVSPRCPGSSQLCPPEITSPLTRRAAAGSARAGRRTSSCWWCRVSVPPRQATRRGHRWPQGPSAPCPCPQPCAATAATSRRWRPCWATKRRRRFGASCWAPGAASASSGSCRSARARGSPPGSAPSPRRRRRR
uniref:REST corepressor 2 n=1 Tax=Taeniopygia guttata TaxID=59729 RepID=A0A674GNX8_TAEGU